jgi:hypothetical protein
MNPGMLPDEVEAVLEAWPTSAKKLFRELMEDASSELQQELVQRAMMFGHSPAEVHAFADALRGFSDDECFEACTLSGGVPDGYTVSQLLRAESDPLYAFELKGGSLSPNDASAPLKVRRPEFISASDDRGFTADPVRRAKNHRVAFDSHSGRVRASTAPGSSAFGNASMQIPLPDSPGAGAGRLLEDLLIEATRTIGVTWREFELDVPGGLSIAQALGLVANAVARSIPVPCVIGNVEGRPLRFLLVMQTSGLGRHRAFQLYEPFSHDLIWANEKDLLGNRELAFENKALRRLLRVALPNDRTL